MAAQANLSMASHGIYMAQMSLEEKKQCYNAARTTQKQANLRIILGKKTTLRGLLGFLWAKRFPRCHKPRDHQHT